MKLEIEVSDTLIQKINNQDSEKRIKIVELIESFLDGIEAGLDHPIPLDIESFNFDLNALCSDRFTEYDPEIAREMNKELIPVHNIFAFTISDKVIELIKEHDPSPFALENAMSTFQKQFFDEGGLMEVFLEAEFNPIHSERLSDLRDHYTKIIGDFTPPKFISPE